MCINSIVINTKFGNISALEYKGKINNISFSKNKINKPNKILLKFKSEIIKFFNKKSKKIDIPFTLSGNYNQNKVWKEILKIKYGKTKTYGEIANKLKLSPRLVGKICGQNKLILVIPCHRVIRSDGSLGGFSAKDGIKLKKKLLEFEN